MSSFRPGDGIRAFAVSGGSDGGEQSRRPCADDYGIVDHPTQYIPPALRLLPFVASDLI
jgi:hypothetical protein